VAKRKRRVSTNKPIKQDWKHEIKVSQDYICPVCGLKGTDYTLDIHHCLAKANKGKNTKENCVAWPKTPCHRNYHKSHGTKRSDRNGNVIE